MNERHQKILKKYIDNRVVLFIQEQRFPRKLQFYLIEPCSLILWQHDFAPRQITTGMASLHFANQAAIEMFLAVLLDENQYAEQSLFEYVSQDENDEIEKVNTEVKWDALLAVEQNSHFIKDKKIGDLMLNVFKLR